MTAKDKLSETELTLKDNNGKTGILNKELDLAKRKIQEITIKMEGLQIENDNLENEAYDLFDKVKTTFSLFKLNYL